MAQIQSANRTRLLLPEYGRNVQKMVSFLKTIEDRDMRNRQAEVVVAIMGNLYPYKRDTVEFRHMLWDHLFMLADFNIDIDTPFEKPTLDLFMPRPERIPYSQRYIGMKHYGANIRKMAQAIVASDSPEQEKLFVAANMAKYMKQKSHDYNQEFPSNEVVIADLKELSGGVLALDEATLDNTRIPDKSRNNNNQQQRKNSGSGPYQKKGQQQNKKHNKYK